MSDEILAFLLFPVCFVAAVVALFIVCSLAGLGIMAWRRWRDRPVPWAGRIYLSTGAVDVTGTIRRRSGMVTLDQDLPEAPASGVVVDQRSA